MMWGGGGGAGAGGPSDNGMQVTKALSALGIDTDKNFGGGGLAWSRRRQREKDGGDGGDVGGAADTDGGGWKDKDKGHDAGKDKDKGYCIGKRESAGSGGSSGRRTASSEQGLQGSSSSSNVPRGLAESPDIVFSLGGPVLFTAPHSLNIWRGGKDGERKRIHKRERYSSELVLKLAAFAAQYLGQPASYIIWNRVNAKRGDAKNLDPNYLTQAQSPFSPWHHALHYFADHWRNTQDGAVPILHIDLHGKMDRKDNFDLDIGMGPMENCWADRGKEAEGEAKEEVAALKQHLAAGMRDAFKKLKGKTYTVHGKQMQMTVEEDPYLNAYWGGATFETISHQSVNLRVPAVQLEVPMTMRKELMRNDDLFKNFAAAVMQSYKCMVTSMKSWDSKPPVCGCKKYLDEAKRQAICAQVFQENGRPFCKTLQECDVMLRELVHVDRTTEEKQI